MVKDMEALCDAYIILANLDASQWRNQRSMFESVVAAVVTAWPSVVLLSLLLSLNSLFLNIEGITIPANQPITKLKNLEDVVVPTMEIKVIYY